jgi:hypothetical protein
VPLVLTAASALRVAPQQLAYFNELVGGPGEGYRYLSDSNIDWGQDLRGLKDYVDREGLPAVYLSYFGTAPPEFYGIRYQCAPAPTNIGSVPPPTQKPLPGTAGREVLAISVANLQGVYLSDPTLYRWVDQRRPVAKVGYSIYVYDPDLRGRQEDRPQGRLQRLLLHHPLLAIRLNGLGRALPKR